MVPASDLRAGMAVRLDGTLYKVVAADYRGGSGKMGGVMHARLQNVETGTFREWRFRSDEVLDDVVPERQPMEFLYADETHAYFMHPETFDQVAVDLRRLGRGRQYVKEGDTVPVELVDGRPIGVVLPDIVEVRVVETAPPAHVQGTDNVWKEARLENGDTVMVPPFIAPGETIRVEVETGAYVERAKKPKRAG